MSSDPVCRKNEQINYQTRPFLIPPGVHDPFNWKPKAKATLTVFRGRHAEDEDCGDDT
jgi:hypothetical protein